MSWALKDMRAGKKKSPPQIRLGARRFNLPESRIVRIGLGIALIIGGILGFLPVLGFWMIPLGVLVISYDVAIARRLRRKTTVWWKRNGIDGRPKNKGNGGRSR